MMAGWRRSGQEPEHGSGISVGGNNFGALQNVVGQNISHVRQSAEGNVQAADVELVAELLALFRAELDSNESTLHHIGALRDMTNTVEASLGTPAAQVGALRGVALALPALVAGTAVQQGGEALAHAIGGMLG
ncbi:hypothetical protein M8Z33_22550 [Streptomyces sp. ZAF1911]|uniref:hypothetical protein n=1 Tax=Streptomyces sp. ZAF1911 TaxID=2944129 RepID=UPI00237C2F60|nr:hypothetical protein [Streptomyces sp. ZAF1911]MDD9379379.1 hypothetical protein [Streptomyces sp. ZAF1911]